MNIRYRFEALYDLYKRYKLVFNYYWKERHNFYSRIFTEQEAKYLPSALSLQEIPVSPTARLTGKILIFVVLTVTLWSFLGKFDIIVNASGKIIPSDYSKTVASVDTAVVKALYVKEGQYVHAGDTLVELDSTTTDAEHDKAQVSSVLSRLAIARMNALIDAVHNNKKPVFMNKSNYDLNMFNEAHAQLNSQYKDYHTKLVRFDESIVLLRSLLDSATKVSNDYLSLLETKDVSSHAWQEKEIYRIDVTSRLNDMINQRNELIAQTIRESYDAIKEASKELNISVQDARRSGEHSKLLILKAPVTGTVQQLAMHTIGGVVQSAQPIMVIVPQDIPIEVEAIIENKDIGFLHEGQNAQVKIDAFDYTRFGTIPAIVSHISRDAIADEKRGLFYSVIVKLDRPKIFIDNSYVSLSPGMSVNVEVKTGERRVIEYILSPILQHAKEALNER